LSLTSGPQLQSSCARRRSTLLADPTFMQFLPHAPGPFFTARPVSLIAFECAFSPPTMSFPLTSITTEVTWSAKPAKSFAEPTDSQTVTLSRPRSQPL